MDELELNILEYCKYIGLIPNIGNWGFEVTYKSLYKDKKLCVVLYIEGTQTYLLTLEAHSNLELFKKANFQINNLIDKGRKLNIQELINA